MSVTIDVDLRGRLNAARDQRRRPTCIVFGVTAAHEHRRGTGQELSTEYLFYMGAQRTHKDPKQGLTRTAARDALMQDGQPLETAWPYLPKTPDAANWKPPPDVGEAHKATIEFAKRTVSEVRTLVKAGTPVVLIMMITTAWNRPDMHGVVRATANDTPTARHAVLAVGSGHASDGEYLLIRNSWGTKWGKAGHGWLPDPDLAQQLEMTGTIA